MQLVWFKRDLRIQDHEALHQAAQAGPVVPLYIVEPGLWQQPDASLRQWRCVREALSTLQRDLGQIGLTLIVRQGDAATIFAELLRKHRIRAVWSHTETGSAWTYARDRAVGSLLRELGIAWHECRQHGVVRGSIDRDRWSRQWEALMGRARYPTPRFASPSTIAPGAIPDRPAPDLAADPCPGRQNGGRDMALQALHSFLDVRGARYPQEMSSPLSAAGSCSRLSTHLAAGTLSMREVVQATRRRRATVAHRADPQAKAWSRALAAFEGRLHWHCHFIQKLESEPAIEWQNLQHATEGLRSATPDQERLRAWQHGQTGWPFVDACMRFLQHNGWLNFRMRAMLMSVASYQLWLHWREPGLHLARQFVDYEPGIHWPQVQMQSGTTGINALRIYNPIKQSRDQDPTGRFIRTWVPELSAVDDAWIHEPWKMPGVIQRRTGVKIGSHYPAPLVEHENAARLARQRILEARRRHGARDQSKAIQHRHGSRKRVRQRVTTNRRQPDLFDSGS